VDNKMGVRHGRPDGSKEPTGRREARGADAIQRQAPRVFDCYHTPALRAVFERMLALAVDIEGQVKSDLDHRPDVHPSEGILSRLGELRAVYDRFLQEVISREGLTVACRKGCPACCHVLPCGLEPLEVMEIYERIRTWPDYADIMRGCAAAMGAFQTLINKSSGGPSTQAYTRALADFALLRLPCVFLDRQRGTCRIYDIRPLICRSVFSLSDPARCDPAHSAFASRQIEVIEPVDEINLILIRINAAISRALGFRFPDILQQALLLWDRLQTGRMRANPSAD